MKTLALSGWGQPYDALAGIAPDATHYDYADHNSIDDALAGIAAAARGHDAVIGWSLGGQLAVRAIAAGLMNPRKLVLIAVPFQFVRVGEKNIGMPPDQFEKFRGNYEKNPERTLAKAWELVILGDSRNDSLRANLIKQEQVVTKNWLNWLDILDGFSCTNIDFKEFPQSLIIHGKNDAVVGYTQAEEFLKSMPQAKHMVYDEAGHAPHWHDPQGVKRHIENYLYV